MAAVRQFDAPWSLTLRMMTLLGVAVLVGVAGVGLYTGPRDPLWWGLPMVGLPLAIGIVSVFFLIRGFEVGDGEVRVLRLGWASRIPLDGLTSVEADPEAMRGSLRTFGNGGLFCFAGRFRNKHLGPYRAWATDADRAVVLRFGDRIVVVTPDPPRRFVEAVRTATGLTG